jgi:hypothetical protein
MWRCGGGSGRCDAEGEHTAHDYDGSPSSRWAVGRSPHDLPLSSDSPRDATRRVGEGQGSLTRWPGLLRDLHMFLSANLLTKLRSRQGYPEPGS